MNYRNLGKAGLKVSEISLGTWMTDLSGVAAADTARDTIKLAYENGINFFDCADVYSDGEAEKFLGKTLKDYPRSSLVVSSKVYFPVGPGVNDRGLSRKHIFEQVDKSLKNMQTDHLDMYFCHRFDTSTDLEETLRALSDLVTSGKVLYCGVSEGWSAARLNKAAGIIDKLGLYPISVVQPRYHMLDRYIEHEIMGVCEDSGIGIVPYSPLAQGLLTGKYIKGRPLPTGSRATHQADKQVNALLTDDNLDKAARISKIAAELGVSMPVLALAWILRKPIISSVITGASKPEQLKSNLAASGIKIPGDAMEKIEEILNFTPFSRHVG